MGYLGILATLFFSLILHPSTSEIVGNPYRLQGVFLYALLIISALSSFSVSIQKLSWKVVLGLVSLQVIAALVIVGRTDLRAIGTLGEPNALAASMLFLWPWIWVGASRVSKGKISIQLTGFFGALVIIALSQSLSGFLGLFLQCIILFLPRIISLKKTIICAVFILICLHITPFFDQSSLYENRGQIWTMALQTGARHPILGNGIGNIQTSLKQTQEENGGYMKYIPVDSSHNIFLDFWIMGGILGLISILLILIFSIKTYIKRGDTLSLILLFGLLVSMCFNPVSVVTLIQFWWLLRLTIDEKPLSA
jgi:O-antigen ligase